MRALKAWASLWWDVLLWHQGLLLRWGLASFGFSLSTELDFSICLLFGNMSKHSVPSILRGEGCPSLQGVCGPVKPPVRKPAMQILWSRLWERKAESFGAVETWLLPQVWGLREGSVMVWGVHVAE